MAKGCAVSNNCDTHAWIANWHQSSCASVDPSVTDESMTPQVVARITNHLEKLKQERKKLRIKSKEKKSQKKKKNRDWKSLQLRNFYSIHQKLSYKLKEKHINSITLKHLTIGLSLSIKTI